MTKPVYYNDNDPFAARWLRNLVSAGLLPAGDVDDRSITEVNPDDLKGYDQCHFFAGIGGWPYALNLAGWPVDRPVWTGSCPCQPLSSAGQHQGHADERHLWPAFFSLIAECRPVCVFGEQVASKDGREWFSGVRADLETLGYACGAAGLPAAGVAAPHNRTRLYWVADAGGVRRPQKHADSSGSHERSGKSRLAQQRPANRRAGDDWRPAPLCRLADPRRGGTEINDTTWQERQAKLRRKYNNGNGFGMTLGMAVRTAGWGTPQARDWKDVGDQSNIPVNGYLPRQVRLAGQPMLAGWTTPQAKEPNAAARPSRAATGRRTEYLGRQVRGPIANGSGAETDITGALNPQFSCWLMGYPQEWVSCADSATP